MILHCFGITDETPDDMMKKFYEEIFPKYRQEEYKKDYGPDRLERGQNLKRVCRESLSYPPPGGIYDI
jgi:hypothetical protein